MKYACPLCGDAVPARRENGRLAVSLSPSVLWLDGQPLTVLGPVQAAILHALLPGTFRATDALLWLISEHAAIQTLQADIKNLRNTLRKHDVPAEIVSLRGHGYQLKMIDAGQ